MICTKKVLQIKQNHLVRLFCFCLNAKTRQKSVVNVLREVLLVGLRMSLIWILKTVISHIEEEAMSLSVFALFSVTVTVQPIFV